MKIGFTGTQQGMTREQLNGVAEFFKRLTEQRLLLHIAERGVEFHHGDSIGADVQAHYLFINVVGSAIGVQAHSHTHPPKNGLKRAFVKGAYETYQEMEYLERNRVIVNDSDFLLAAPAGNNEIVRSGTWYTVRYARRMKKPIMIICPDGEERRERWSKLAW